MLFDFKNWGNWVVDEYIYIIGVSNISDNFNSYLYYFRPISRLSWGVEVPGESEDTVYVWLDALVNYLTVAGYGSENSSNFSWPPTVHVIGNTFYVIFYLEFHFKLLKLIQNYHNNTNINPIKF